jgi:hypothetical protein
MNEDEGGRMHQDSKNSAGHLPGQGGLGEDELGRTEFHEIDGFRCKCITVDTLPKMDDQAWW